MHTCNLILYFILKNVFIIIVYLFFPGGLAGRSRRSKPESKPAGEDEPERAATKPQLSSASDLDLVEEAGRSARSKRGPKPGGKDGEPAAAATDEPKELAAERVASKP